MTDKPIIVGKVSAVHGVKGWIKLFSWTQPKENITRYNPLLIEQTVGQWQTVKVISARQQGRTIVAQLDGLDSRDDAEKLIGKSVAIQPDQLPKLEEGWYWSQLIGLTVETLEGNVLGTVTDMQETGANDVVVIGQGSEEVLIPFVVGPVVKQVDTDAGKMLVDWDPEYL